MSNGNGLTDGEKAAIGIAGGVAVIGTIYLLYLFRDKDIRIKVRLLYEDVETGGVRPVPGGAAVRVLDHDGASTPFEMGRTLVLADGVIDATVSDDGTRELKPDIMFEVTAPAPPAAPGLITGWPGPGIANRRRRRDPMVGGISVANVAITAGTVGAAVSSRNTEERRLLSNWHVLSRTVPAPAAPLAPAAPPADNIVQSGPLDGGVHPADTIGQLADHRLGRYTAAGVGLDAAVARLNATRPGVGGGAPVESVALSRLLVDDEAAPGAAGGPPAGVQGWELIDDDLIRGLIPESEINPPAGISRVIGLEVWKSGRTTGVTRGRIAGVLAANAPPGLLFAPGLTLILRRLIRVLVRNDAGAPYVLADGGDSGSVVLEVGTNRAVGLVFARNTPQHVLTCRLGVVLDQLLSNLNVHRVEEDYHFRRFYRASYFGMDQSWTSRDDVPETLRSETFFPSYGETTLERTIRVPLTGLQIHARFVYFDAALRRFMPLPEGVRVQIRDRTPGAARPTLGTATTNANGEIHAVFAAPPANPQVAFLITRDPANRFPEDPSMRKLDRLGFFAGGAAVSRYQSENGAFLRFDAAGSIAMEVNVPISEDAARNTTSAGAVDLPLVFPVSRIIGPATARRERDTAYRAYNGAAGTTWSIRNLTQNVARANPPNGPTLTYRPHAGDNIGDRIRITSPRGSNTSIVITVAAARDARIVSDRQARSFCPARSSDTGAVRLFADMPTPGRQVTWEQNQLDAAQQGQVVFDPNPGAGGVTTLRARFPGRTRVRAVVADPGGDITTPYVTISVPQFVRVAFLSEFDQDLVAFGLRREPPAGGSLTDEQKRLNERVKQAVMDQTLNVARWHYDNASANVRFTTRDLADLAPMPSVLAEVGGDRPAAGHAAVPPNRNDGARMQLTRAANTGVFPREFLNFSTGADRAGAAAPAAKDARFDDVFGALRPGAGGTPVGSLVGGALDFPEATPGMGAAGRARYDRIARAIRSLGNLIGEAIAHNVGHTLGLAHSAAADRQLMDAEADRGFVERSLSGSGLGAEFTSAEADQLHRTVGQVRPFITNVTPISGPVAGGTTLTIDGRGFTDAADTHLTVMGKPVTALNVVNEGRITCRTPARAGWRGPTRVFIANSEGTYLLPRGFRYT